MAGSISGVEYSNDLSVRVVDARLYLQAAR
jgi:hypothetical protein